MSTSSPKLDAIEPGRLVGRYRIEHALGSGGMADVFYALHEDLQRPAAIKILKASLATDETNLQRFMNEARSAAALIHPNIVQVYDVGRDDELRFIAQEFIPGANLRQYLALDATNNFPPSVEPSSKSASANFHTTDIEAANQPTVVEDRQLELPEVLSILLQILAALNKSASSGIVHRDIKPENIMLTRDGEVKVADFGLARTFLGDDPKLTRAGTTLGTPMYMSPEQIQGREVDIRSDLYSLGVTLFHMIAGRPPFTGDTQLALAMMHTQAEVPGIEQFRNAVPGSLSELVQRLLRKSPDERFSSPQEVLDFLREKREADLQAIWPEQTLPLPRASEVGHQPSLQATMELQALLRKRKKDAHASPWLRRGLATLAVIACLVIGLIVNFERPIEVPDTKAWRGVPQMENAKAQFQYALVSEQIPASRDDKWEAVEHYFARPKASAIDRYYIGLARIHLARVQQRKTDANSAVSTLEKTIDDPNADNFIKGYSLISKAIILEEEDKGDTDDEQAKLFEKLERIVKQAYQIYVNLEEAQGSHFKEQIDWLLEYSFAERTRKIWTSETG